MVLAFVLDEVCWLRRIHVANVDHYSVALSYALIGVDNAVLYVDTEKVDGEVREDVAGRVASYVDVVPDLRAMA